MSYQQDCSKWMRDLLKLDKLIAIKDAPIPIKFFGGLDKAYFKGDIFTYQIHKGMHIIYHPILNMNMHIDIDNFMLLNDFRDQQIDKLIH